MSLSVTDIAETATQSLNKSYLISRNWKRDNAAVWAV